MSDDDPNPPNRWPTRRLARWAGVTVALIAVGWAAWYFGIYLPDKREAAAAAKLRATNARSIPDLNLDLVWMAPGSFMMGTAELGVGSDDERPATRVTLTQPFWLGRTAVTQAQYQAVAGYNPSLDKDDEFPVDNVSREEAKAFCQNLTEREKAAGRLPTGYVYTLPTEAQREYACRAGTTGDYAGDLDAIAWYMGNCGGYEVTVGTKQPNAWGLNVQRQLESVFSAN